MEVFIYLFIAIFCLYALFSGLKEDSNIIEKQRNHIQDICIRYKDPLARKRKQLVYVDAYGDIEDIEWRKEVVKFFNSKITDLPAGLHTKKTIDANSIFEIIDTIAKLNEAEDGEYDEEMTGLDYESFCASILIENGWNARVSKASGDQGADIIAEIDNTRLVIQCKKHSSPVGNKAVQEVYASRQFYEADYAVVVTNNDYTKSARQLADSNNVLLLHHDELSNLEKHVKCFFEYGQSN